MSLIYIYIYIYENSKSLVCGSLTLTRVGDGSDEVHHRTTDGDLVLLILRSLIAKTRDMKIIMMSATLQDSLLTSYFHANFGSHKVACPYFVGKYSYLAD